MNYIIQSTATPAFTLVKGSLQITEVYGGFPGYPLKDFSDFTKTAAVAETRQVTDLTITQAASTKYSVRIVQYVGAGNGDRGTTIKTRTFMHTTDASPASDEVRDALISQINASDLQIVATTSTAKVRLTANAGYPTFVVTISAGNITAANATAGVIPIGTAAQLSTIDGVEDGETYITYASTIKVKTGVDSFGNARYAEEPFRLYVCTGLTVTDLDSILAGPDFTTAADTEAYVAKTGTVAFP